ncbi:MAG: OmpA family protein [Chitinivibrionales bacterium]|nr:OmpA family protein [Chitinivibrionales bacterium]
MRGKGILSFVVVVVVALGGCNGNRTATGGAVGAGVGGTVGGVIGQAGDNTALGVLLGAAVGGAAGAAIGYYMDRQAEEYDEQLDKAKVERAGEGIRITYESDELFDPNSADLAPRAQPYMQELARLLQENDDTQLLIVGHTDSIGPERYNKLLSEMRAQAIADYLIDEGVAQARLSTLGIGEDEPVATNETIEGRRQNNRIEIAVYAGEELRREAEEGKIS